MTAKRMKKLYMAQGVPRDVAEFISKHVTMNGKDGRRYSKEEMYNSITVETKRIKKEEKDG